MSENKQKKDHYKTLDIKSNASDSDIKKAYKKMCLKWHPDKAPQKNQEKKEEFGKMFKNIKEAYKILSDPLKRDKYDNPPGEYFQGDMYRNRQPNNGKKEFTFGAGGMGDIFSTFFGGMSGDNSTNTKSNNPNNPNNFASSKSKNFNSKDFEKAFDIPFFKNNNGTQNNKNYNNQEDYSDDSESEYEDSHTESPVQCENTKETLDCTVDDLINGASIKFNFKRKIKRGNRLINKNEKITVEIPINVDVSEPIIIKNMGSLSNKNMIAGDLELKLNVKPYKKYKLVGNDLYYTIDIDIKKAIKGFTKTITCLDGDKLQLTVPPMKTSTKEINVNNKGLNGKDLIINFNVDFAFFFDGKINNINDDESISNDTSQK